MATQPIGVFDSGLGGLTVVRALTRLLPGEDIVYFGDTGRVPYGTKSPETIEKYAAQDCRFLLRHNVKLIIAACGTVSSVAPHILEAMPVPAIGVVNPAVEAALAATRNRRIGVIATAATVRSDVYRRTILQRDAAATVVSAACPLFVPLVESGWCGADDPVALAAAGRYLAAFRDTGVDTLILGCTHYPLLAAVIGGIMGPGVTLIDAGAETGRVCAARLGQQTPAAAAGQVRFYVSDYPGDFIEVAERFLERTVAPEDVEVIEIEAL